MWTNRNYFLWFEIKSKKGKQFSFPISLFVLRELFESFVELLVVISLFVPNAILANSDSRVKFTMRQLRELIDVVDRMILLLEYEHHLDLVDVEAKDAVVKIVLR